ncbi:MAG: 5-(carboxyamino)imidazole ribonucleotide mutase [Bacteroides sp.]|nr:5-(carboxyamino)imidazole ribonucleotide mutase [Bacteroidales bacterium]MBD5284108.1 5-(carboxyamino)imidazole ribonucleotide mutase [Bacteroides sp.]MBD5336401.1 5-(carboxyamino)imidazole ribonucleotide mutase [Bacteroides sp.]
MKIGIVMGSTSDLGVMKGAAEICDRFGVEYEMKVLSAHRTPAQVEEWASSARGRGFAAIIAGAGGAAHLGGVVAAFTTLPVIGVPIKSRSLEGLDSLLSMVQMPSGIPVATVGIDGAKNAALLAIEMMAITDTRLKDEMDAFRKEQADKVLAANEAPLL